MYLYICIFVCKYFIYALDELYAAGIGRTIGIDPDPYIRILAVASKKQIDSIMEKYSETYKNGKQVRDKLVSVYVYIYI